MSATHPVRSDLSAFDRASVWLNSEPLTTEDLRGRVVLVDIWTYSCVNWLRTLPPRDTVRVEADGLAEAADWDTLGTGETYVGYGRGAGR